MVTQERLEAVLLKLAPITKKLEDKLETAMKGRDSPILKELRETNEEIREILKELAE